MLFVAKKMQSNNLS